MESLKLLNVKTANKHALRSRNVN